MRPWTICSLRVRKKRSMTPLVSGWPTKARLGGHAPRPHLGLEVLGHEAAAVIVAELHAAGGVAAEMGELLVHGHAHRLEGLAARASFADVPAERLGVPMLGRGEQPDLAVLDGADLRAVDGPHDVRRVGHDLAVVGLGRPRPGAVRREQAALAHQPQHPLARDARGRPARGSPRPRLAMALARPGRAGEVGPDRRKQIGVRHRRLRPAPTLRARGRRLLSQPPRRVRHDERGTPQTAQTRATP